VTRRPAHGTIDEVPLWEAEFDQKVRAFRHRIAPGFGHALLTPVQAFLFESLGLSAAIWLAGDDWFPIHTESSSVSQFESVYDADGTRSAYNGRCFAEVKRTRRPVCGEHAGFSDFFVPIVKGREVVAVLVVGPFGRARPTAAGILERWRTVTRRQGHPADPEFAGYLSASLSTVVFDDLQLKAFRRLLESWVSLASSEGEPEELANAIEKDRVVLDGAQRVARIWESVRTMIDERSSRAWHTRAWAPSVFYLGLTRPPDRVLVGLATIKSGALDPVEEIVRLDGFQRGVVDFVASSGALTGRVGDHGVVFVATTSGSERARIARLTELAERVSTWALRQFDVSLHFGIGAAPKENLLSRTYQSALAAAQVALFEDKSVVVIQPQVRARPTSLWNMRRSLGRLLDEHPERVEAHFDQYLEVVMAECAYRSETARVHLELGFERLMETLARQGALDEQSFAVMREDLERSVMSARTLSEIVDHFRRAVANLAKAAQAPVPARQERSLERALAHIEQHYTEPLRLAQVARVAGLTPSYFSKLFIQNERVPFNRYVARLRVERAKRLLTTTRLNLTHVARLSGFPTAAYLCTAFGEATGTTPNRWRVRHPGPKAPLGEKTKWKTPENEMKSRRRSVRDRY
jgi:AraC-like DNA-binding protein